MRADYLGTRPIVRARISCVLDYSAKLGRRRDVVDEDDLFIVLPPSGAEPEVSDVPALIQSARHP